MGRQERQLGFSDWEPSVVKKQTRREKFFSEMEKVVPCGRYCSASLPLLPCAGTARRKTSLSSRDHAADPLDAELVLPQ